MTIYTLSSKVYLDTHLKCYKKIITINKKPDGPLGNLVSRVRENKLSVFQQQSNCCEWKPCFLAINHPNGMSGFLTVDELPDLFSFLVENNYTIDSQTTQMINQSQNIRLDGFICFISFNC